MLSEAQVAEFRRIGFLKGGRVLDDAQADALRERLGDVIEGRTDAKPEANRNMKGSGEQVVIQVVNVWEADDLFREHLYNPAICAMVAAVATLDPQIAAKAPQPPIVASANPPRRCPSQELQAR